MLLLWQRWSHLSILDEPKSEWAIKKAQQSHVQLRTASPEEGITSHSSTPHPTTKESIPKKV
jgi:hypothetical protein